LYGYLRKEIICCRRWNRLSATRRWIGCLWKRGSRWKSRFQWAFRSRQWWLSRCTGNSMMTITASALRFQSKGVIVYIIRNLIY
jgi:hypothetical protein